MTAALKAPFPYFGGKSRIADLVWQRFGQVDNYVEPFFGSGAVLLGCPHPGHTETVNGADGLLANFWRSLQLDPDAVALYADWPVNEADLHARHRWPVDHRSMVEELMQDQSPHRLLLYPTLMRCPFGLPHFRFEVISKVIGFEVIRDDKLYGRSLCASGCT